MWLVSRLNNIVISYNPINLNYFNTHLPFQLVFGRCIERFSNLYQTKPSYKLQEIIIFHVTAYPQISNFSNVWPNLVLSWGVHGLNWALLEGNFKSIQASKVEKPTQLIAISKTNPTQHLRIRFGPFASLNKKKKLEC